MKIKKVPKKKSIKTNKKNKSKPRIKKIFKTRRKKLNFNKIKKYEQNKKDSTALQTNLNEKNQIVEKSVSDERKNETSLNNHQNENEMLIINGETIILIDVKNMFKGSNLNINGKNVNIFDKNKINHHYNLEIVEGLQKQLNRINSEINDFRNTVEHLNSRNEPFNTAFRGFLEAIDAINDTNKDIKKDDNNELNKDVKKDDNNELNKDVKNDNINDEEKKIKENKEKENTEDITKKIIMDSFTDIFQIKKE